MNTTARLSPIQKKCIERFIALLQEDLLPWQKDWRDASGEAAAQVARPFNPVTGKPFRGAMNLLILMSDGRTYADPRWMTLRQANEKGWRVRKGEKGVLLYLMRPSIGKRDREEFLRTLETEGRVRTGKATYQVLFDTIFRRDDSGIEKRQVDPNKARHKALDWAIERGDIKARTYLSTFTVFNGTQIRGIPKYVSPCAREMDDDVAARTFDALAEAMKIPVVYGANHARYVYLDDRDDLEYIEMPALDQFDDSYAFLATGAHEAAHATGHRSRLNRRTLYEQTPLAIAKEEIVAETAAFLTGLEVGIDLTRRHEAHMRNHAAYVKSYIQLLTEEPNAFFECLKQATVASNYLLDHIPKRVLSQSSREADEKRSHTERTVETERPSCVAAL